MRNSLSLYFKTCLKQKYLILMVIIPTVCIFLFTYLPMYGLILAFKDFKLGDTFLGSEWVGLKWFHMFFNNPMFFRLLKNTFLLGIYWTLIGWPAPIILALLLNEVMSEKFKKMVQTVTYLPYFISGVIVVGILMELASREGNINQFLGLFGIEPIMFFQEPLWFKPLYIMSGMWQNLGYSSIIYLAALAGVDVQLYEAATVDGANRWQRIFNVTIPSILPTITILFILNIGSLFSNDFQKILLMYNPQTYETADVFGTYIFREGISNSRYSYSIATGLVFSIISCVFIYLSNYFTRKVSPDNSMF